MRAPNSSASNSFASVWESVTHFVSHLREVGERRRMVHNLAALDDYMLRDIGLTRFDVDAALLEPTLTDGTIILAERARELRQNQRAMAREAQAWGALGSDGDARGVPALAKRVA